MKLQSETEVLIVGAGPVGLFAALTLVENGVSVQVIDKEAHASRRSYAAALHPGSVSLLERHGLLEELREHGHCVERIAVHDGGRRAATMNLAALKVEFPYVLVVPQDALEAILMRRLHSKGVDIFWQHQAFGLKSENDVVAARVGRLERISKGYPIARTDWIIDKEFDVVTRFVVGADGYHSFVRRRLGIEFLQMGPAERFSVYEFSGDIGSPAEARVVFHDGTVSVFWPLGPELGRWSFQFGSDEPPEVDLETLRALIKQRAAECGTQADELRWTDSVSFERLLAERFGNERVWLAGDAAHVTGPVGAQSMNVGLREARDLAMLIHAIQKGEKDLEAVDRYGTDRMAEWMGLLQGIPRPAGHGPEGLAGRGARMLSCVPASGETMHELLGQVGLRLEQ